MASVSRDPRLVRPTSLVESSPGPVEAASLEATGNVTSQAVSTVNVDSPPQEQVCSDGWAESTCPGASEPDDPAKATGEIPSERASGVNVDTSMPGSGGNVATCNPLAEYKRRAAWHLAAYQIANAVQGDGLGVALEIEPDGDYCYLTFEEEQYRCETPEQVADTLEECGEELVRMARAVRSDLETKTQQVG